MNGEIQVERNILLVNKRLDKLEAEINVLIATLKKRGLSSLDIGLKDMAMGRVHTYRSAKELANDIWG